MKSEKKPAASSEKKQGSRMKNAGTKRQHTNRIGKGMNRAKRKLYAMIRLCEECTRQRRAGRVKRSGNCYHSMLVINLLIFY